MELDSSWEVAATSGSTLLSPLTAPLSASVNPEVNCTPSSSYDYQDDRFMRHVVSIVVPVLFGVIVILGLIGNAFVIIIVLEGAASKYVTAPTCSSSI